MANKRPDVSQKRDLEKWPNPLKELRFSEYDKFSAPTNAIHVIYDSSGNYTSFAHLIFNGDEFYLLENPDHSNGVHSKLFLKSGVSYVLEDNSTDALLQVLASVGATRPKS